MKRVFTLIVALSLALSAAAEARFYHLNRGTAKRLMAMEENRAIVDVRSPERFAKGHIPDAVNIPLADIAAGDIPGLPDRSLMTFVYGDLSRDSREAAQCLAERGYTLVVEFGGFLMWTGSVTSDDAPPDYDDDDEDLCDEDLYGDDPYLARDYSDPEDFYEDMYDEFYDYEEAEDYYYEYGGY